MCTREYVSTDELYDINKKKKKNTKINVAERYKKQLMDSNTRNMHHHLTNNPEKTKGVLKDKTALYSHKHKITDMTFQ